MSEAFDSFLNECREKYPAEDFAAIERALEVAQCAHSGQMRDSGEPYITHPLAVAQILLELDIDADCVVAALLHDVIEDCDVTLAQLQEQFGEPVAVLVDGVTKLRHTAVAIAREDRQAESLRKMFISMAKDLRVIVIKLADRLHNMRTLGVCAPEKRVRVARETMAFYAPFAHRLGIGTIKCELEDLAFMYMYPEDYKRIKDAIEPEKEARMRLIETASEKISKSLTARGIDCKISGRPKHLYSIYRKMKEQNLTINEIYDRTALRVIVGTRDECYLALGEVHALWNTVPGREKDYISRPKNNAYQSLHTTLFGDDGLIFEVQIRTAEMHRAAEYGVAAHWSYKEKRKDRSELDERLGWFREALEYQDFSTTAREFVDSVQQDFLSEYVFVLTPRGELIDLPAGSTPLDFAYRIHSKVGNSVYRAKVNGALVALDYVLKTHDVVEIITSRAAQPKRDWLKMVKTKRAKDRLNQWFKRHDRAENIEKGNDALAAALRRYNMSFESFSDDDFAEILKRYSKPTMTDIYAAIGEGGITADQIAARLTEPYRREAERDDMLTEKLAQSQSGAPTGNISHSSGGVILKGYEDTKMAISLARCCTPLPGDPIFGYITRGRGTTIHRADCRNAAALKASPERIIDAEWVSEAAQPFFAYISLRCRERMGLLRDISNKLWDMNVDMNYINADSVADGRHVSVKIMFRVTGSSRLTDVMNALRRIEGVEIVTRVNG